MSTKYYPYQFFFDDVAFGTTQVAGPVPCAGWRRVIVTIQNLENVDGVTVTPEIQFNTKADGTGSWSTGTGELFYWNENAPAADADVFITTMTFAGTAMTASGSQHYSVPCMGPAVRVNLVLTGAAGHNDITCTICGA